MYCVALSLVNVLATIASDSILAAFVVLLVWLAAAILLFVIVTWFRDDDWLAAGFLLGLTLLVSAVVSDTVVFTIKTGSIAGAVFQAGTASMRVLVRAIVLVPLSGGAVALARWITERVGRRRARAVPPTP
jgi:hypothetical protein